MAEMLKWVSAELEVWARWSRCDWGPAGYRCVLGQTARKRAIELGELSDSRMLSNADEARALQVEKALLNAPRILRKVAKQKYLYRLYQSEAARRLRVSQRTYRTYIALLHRFLAQNMRETTTSCG